MEALQNLFKRFLNYLRVYSKDILLLGTLALTVWLTAFRYTHDVERLYYELLRTNDLYPPYNYRILPIALEIFTSTISGLSLETVSVTLSVLFMFGASLILRTKEELIWSALPMAWLALIGWRAVLLQDCLAFFLLTICLVYNRNWVSILIAPLLGLTREISVGFLFFIESYRKRYDVAFIAAIIGGIVALAVRFLIPGEMGFTPLIILAPENLTPDTIIRIVCDLSFVIVVWYIFGERDTWWILVFWSVLMFVMAMPSEVRLWLPIFLLTARNSLADSGERKESDNEVPADQVESG